VLAKATGTGLWQSCFGDIDAANVPRYAAAMKQSPLTLRRWRRVEYERLVDLGAFEGDPVELLGGQLMVAEPKGSSHATAVDMADDAIRSALPGGWIIRVQNPLALDDESAPEPDIAVVRGARGDYLHAHPARPALIIEVAESSLVFDRVEKGSLYARAGIVDYWIVNLVDRVLEVYRKPGADVAAPYGWRYVSVERFTPPSLVVPLGVPAAPIPVAALLP
jgi:Uma2 family endonuclease